MLCKNAITGKLQTVSEDTPVEEALALLKKSKEEALVVTDHAGNPVGLFSIAILLKNILPVSVPVNEGIELHLTVSAAPGIARRFKNISLVPVGNVMERKIHGVPEGAPLWEGIQLLLMYKMPVLVVDTNTGKASGLITAHSAFDELNRSKDSET